MDKSFLKKITGFASLFYMENAIFSFSPVFEENIEAGEDSAEVLYELYLLIGEQDKKYPKKHIDYVSALARPHVEKFTEQFDELLEQNKLAEEVTGFVSYINLETMYIYFRVMMGEPQFHQMMAEQALIDTLVTNVEDMYFNVLDDIDGAMGMSSQRIAPTVIFSRIDETDLEEVA